MLKKITEINLRSKTVLLRTDYNVPLKGKRIEKNSHWRIKATLDTINYLINQKAKIIILCHMGRPKGRIVEELRVKPVAKFLAKILKRNLIVYKNEASFFNKDLGPIVSQFYFIPRKRGSTPDKMNPGDIIILENIRFHPEEKSNSRPFAKLLSTLGDVYIGEAFAAAHRDDVSVSLLPKFLPSAAGFLLEKEINVLEDLNKKVKRPLLFIMGGAKAKTKTELIQILLPRVDDILVGGVLANTILAAQGIAVGKSIVEKETAKLLNDLEITNTKIHLPVDVIASPSKDGKSLTSIRPVGNIGKENMILDIGPDTILLFRSIIEKAKTIIWNGPMGYTEVKKFKQGTDEIMKALIKNESAFKVVGGGESISLIHKNKAFNKIGFVSTGGGALLEFLAGKKLPGIEVLKK